LLATCNAKTSPSCRNSISNIQDEDDKGGTKNGDQVLRNEKYSRPIAQIHLGVDEGRCLREETLKKFAAKANIAQGDIVGTVRKKEKEVGGGHHALEKGE